MNKRKIKQCCPDFGKNFNLLDNSIRLFLPFSLWLTLTGNTFASEDTDRMSQINNVRQLKSKETLNQDDNERSQITNVQQLRDVSPTDWAYEALRSLVDRYSDARSLAPDGVLKDTPSDNAGGSHRCISGFPNQTYRGNQPLSRYEFAAGLNSCLNQIERLIASTGSVSQSDLDTVQRLSQEFEAELATIGGRVDSLESQVAVLEDNQFSTTTKFSGNLFFNATGATASDDVLAETVSLDTPLNLRRAGRDVNNNPIVSNITEDPKLPLAIHLAKF